MASLGLGRHLVFRTGSRRLSPLGCLRSSFPPSLRTPGWHNAAKTVSAIPRGFHSSSDSHPSKFSDHRQKMVSQSVAKATLPNLELKSTRSKIRRRFFLRFLDYLSNYDQVLAKVLPENAARVLTLFTRGSKMLFSDMNTFTRVWQVLFDSSRWEKACSTLSRRQLELYMSLPADLWRVAPVLTLSALPLMQNVVFPLAMMYPKWLLSSHFWTPEVRKEVADESVSQRHHHYRAIFRDLQIESRKLHCTELGLSFKESLKKLTGKEGQHPSVVQLLELVSLFAEKGPLSLKSINSLHVRHLMAVHGLHGWFSWRFKLQQFGNLLMQIDRAVMRESPSTLSEEELDSCCQRRGLNVNDLTREEKMTYLTEWLALSVELDAKSVSLLLHLPILLGYNHKTRYWDAKTIL